MQAADIEQWSAAVGAAQPTLAAGSKAMLARADTAMTIVGALALGGAMLAPLCGWLIRASIKESLESTVHCVMRIAGGDLETKIESPGKDELSWLRAELNSMRKKLRTMVLEVRPRALCSATHLVLLHSIFLFHRSLLGGDG